MGSMTDTIPLDGLPPARRRWAVIAVITAVSMSALDTSIVNAVLPTIAADLHATPADSVWVVNSYQLAVVATLLPFASLGEIVGFRRVYWCGVTVFTIASLLCALSWSLGTLISARVLQGLGGAGVMSVNTALIRFIYPSNRLGRGVGLNALVVAVSTAVGPTVSSGIMSVATWPWLFAVNVPVGVLALVLALRTLPPTPLASHRFDWGSALLNAGTFGLLIFAIGEGAHSASRAATAAALGGAVVLGVLLVRRQAGLAAPILPVDLFRRRMFALSSLTSMCSFAAQGLSFVSLPFYFQMVLGRTPVETGLLLTPWPVVTGLIAPIAGPMSDRFPPAILGGVGMAVLCAGLALLATLPPYPDTFDIVWRMMICGGGFGFFQSPNLRAIMSSAPPNRSGGASGIIATSRLVGQSVGAALVALCFGLSGAHGPALALALGAGFAGAAGIASFSRLMAR
jgi:MFS transporter, DHA2 family, multidrug resistance protein